VHSHLKTQNGQLHVSPAALGANNTFYRRYSYVEDNMTSYLLAILSSKGMILKIQDSLKGAQLPEAMRVVLAHQSAGLKIIVQ